MVSTVGVAGPIVIVAPAGRAAAARIAMNRVAFSRFFMFPPIRVSLHALVGLLGSRGQAARCIPAQFLCRGDDRRCGSGPFPRTVPRPGARQLCTVCACAFLLRNCYFASEKHLLRESLALEWGHFIGQTRRLSTHWQNAAYSLKRALPSQETAILCAGIRKKDSVCGHYGALEDGGWSWRSVSRGGLGGVKVALAMMRQWLDDRA